MQIKPDDVLIFWKFSTNQRREPLEQRFALCMEEGGIFDLCQKEMEQTPNTPAEWSNRVFRWPF